MKIILHFYLLGCFVSLLMTILVFCFKRKMAEKTISKLNEQISKGANLYESVNFIDDKMFYALSFLASWLQVISILNTFIPHWSLVIAFFLRLITSLLLFIHKKIIFLLEKSIKVHNKLIVKYNKKYGFEN